MTKNFQEQLADLENGLKEIQKVIDKPKTLKQQRRAEISYDIQKTRINFFKRGYNLRNKELREQQKLTATNINKAPEVEG